MSFDHPPEVITWRGLRGGCRQKPGLVAVEFGTLRWSPASPALATHAPLPPYGARDNTQNLPADSGDILTLLSVHNAGAGFVFRPLAGGQLRGVVERGGYDLVRRDGVADVVFPRDAGLQPVGAPLVV